MVTANLQIRKRPGEVPSYSWRAARLGGLEARLLRTAVVATNLQLLMDFYHSFHYYLCNIVVVLIHGGISGVLYTFVHLQMCPAPPHRRVLSCACGLRDCAIKEMKMSHFTVTTVIFVVLNRYRFLLLVCLRATMDLIDGRFIVCY